MARDDLSDLLVFLEVARERSFTKAAKKLVLSQSTLSRAVQRLESSLGVRLLTRNDAQRVADGRRRAADDQRRPAPALAMVGR